jgi:uncharacterized membrane protein
MRVPDATVGFVSEIAGAARQREIQRQLRHNRMRKAIARARALMGRSVPRVQAEFLRALAAALIGSWLLSLLLHAVAGIDPLYTLSALGLIYSGQSTYHKYRLAIDPGYKVPRCRCAGRVNDDTETVLRSRASSIAGVPNSLLGALAYAALIALQATDHTSAIVALASAAVLLSVYLSYVMTFRIRGLCSTCVSLCAINLLILLNVLL